MRVLLVEDEAAILELLRTFLARAGYSAVAVESAVEARAAAEEMQQSGLSAAIVDLTLRDASGMELIRELRAAMPLLPVVVMSGQALPESRMPLPEGEPAYCLMKPFLPKALLELLETVTAQSARSSNS